MIEILRNKNSATRFQILVEIANSGPNIQQQDIAKKLYVTPQAVSEYTRQLVDEGLLVSDGRSKYRLTSEGVNWVIRILRELREYDTIIERAITNISVCTAVAADDLIDGQTVGLEMRDGMLFATADVDKGARGIATSAAGAGNDVGVSSVEGIVPLEMSKVTILKLPHVQRGGSNAVAIETLKKQIGERKPVGAIGIEAIVTLRKLGVSNIYAYGVTAAAIEAVKTGLCPVIVCVDDEIPGLTRKLGEEDIDYEIIDVKKI
jgi:putative transcriptional regulator